MTDDIDRIIRESRERRDVGGKLAPRSSHTTLLWAVFVLVVLLVTFAVSAFVSRDTCHEYGRAGRTCSTGSVTYWWDRL